MSDSTRITTVLVITGVIAAILVFAAGPISHIKSVFAICFSVAWMVMESHNKWVLKDIIQLYNRTGRLQTKLM